MDFKDNSRLCKTGIDLGVQGDELRKCDFIPEDSVSTVHSTDDLPQTPQAP